MSVKAFFPKNHDRERVTTFVWPDGTAATTPLRDVPKRLPHDLEHYVVEAIFRPTYGFWGLVERKGPFDSLTLVRGRWPKGHQQWWSRVKRIHGSEMLKSEATNLEALFRAQSSEEVDRLIPALQRQLRRAYRLSAGSDFMESTRQQFHDAWSLDRRLRETWRRVPIGGGLEVSFPPASKPRIHARLDTDSAAEAAGRNRTNV